MQQHLRLSRRSPCGCYAQLTWRYAPLDFSCAVTTPDDLRGHARLPAVPTQMPCSSPADQLLGSRADADHALRTAWTCENLPNFLPDVTRDETQRFADAVVRAWQPTGCLQTDDITYQLASFADDDDDDGRLWALYLWCQDSLVYRRFQHLAVPVFQRLKRDVGDMVCGMPLGRLLAWQQRMDRAYVPARRDDAPLQRPSGFDHEQVF
eukprot:s572_g21.t1